MPLIRIVGNRLFAWLLSALAMQSVLDTASGMRVLRRGALDNLYPLPDGLHFTPAMSARALMEGKLKLLERPMPYSERTGRSKLSVIRDGVRFLSIIVRAAVTFRPTRPLLMVAGVCALLAFLCALQPLASYLRHFRLDEWVIYRVLLSSLIATIAGLVLCTAIVAGRIAEIAHGRWITSKPAEMLNALFAPRPRAVCQAGLLGAGIAVVLPGMIELLETGHMQMHWSRAVLGSLLVVASAMLALTGFLLRMMSYMESNKDNRAQVRPPERVRLSHSSRPPMPAVSSNPEHAELK